MSTTAEDIKESREILDELYDDLDSYELLFESEILDNTNDSISDGESDLINDLIDLKDKFYSFMSTNKNQKYAEGEEAGYISASEQVERIIKKYRKDFYG